MRQFFTIFILITGLIQACQNSHKNQPFVVHKGRELGIDFENTVTPRPDLNIFNYLYFYNGGGVGAGDFNNDGLTDLVFTANLKVNKIYLNQGKLKFKDITKASGFKAVQSWSTGVSVVDINQDGLLDIYISQVGKYLCFNAHNLLFVCKKIDEKGIPHYEEESVKYGLDLVGFGTQAAFFDYDLDGDLDFFQLNHSVHDNATFNQRSKFQGTTHPLAGDSFFENVSGKYIEKTKTTGISASAVGYGLGLAFSDINFDGYPDFYVGNDFHENDYLYINQKNKTFKDELLQRIDHTSRFSMGVDIADLNNDAAPEIFSLDMLPNDPLILKRSEGEDNYYNFQFRLSQGYNPQFARNNLQLNERNGHFAEIAQFSGVHATDWSWSTLLFDFENDGLKDIFISNGINKRVNDMDYITFVSSQNIQNRINNQSITENDLSLTELLPEIKIPNKLFVNQGDLQFKDLSDQIEGNKPSFSNGCLYADLDNDGDLEIVTNNINDSPFIYENINSTKNNFLKINLKGSKQNRNAIGAKAFVYAGGQQWYVEKFPVKGFQSSAETHLLIGVGQHTLLDSVLVIFPDHKFKKWLNLKTNQTLQVGYNANLPLYNFQRQAFSTTATFQNVTAMSGLGRIITQENAFTDFDFEGLLPHMLSTEGPAACAVDWNLDGRDDLFLGGAKGFPAHLYLQKASGSFIDKHMPLLMADKEFEDVDATVADINGDKLPDLVVASGGYYLRKEAPELQPRVYLNDGNGGIKAVWTLPVKCNAGTVEAADFDQDGRVDIFIGVRSEPMTYGQVSDSYFLFQKSKGHFVVHKEKA